MKHLRIVAILILAGFMLLCSQAFAAGSGQDIAKGNNEFALDMYKKLVKPGSNTFFSPYSIETALGMAFAGARGTTEKAMAKTLHLPDNQAKVNDGFRALITDLNSRSKGGKYQLNVANRMWAQKGLKLHPDYQQTLQKYYGSDMVLLDFMRDSEKARKTINKWIEKMTNNKIKELLAEGVIDSGTQLVLTNAIYFLGNWDSQFDEKKTAPADFSVTAAQKIKVPMMTQKHHFNYKETKTAQVVELPYKGRELSMIVVLPKERNGLRALESRLSANDLDGYMTGMEGREVVVYLPKFKTSSTFSLKDQLTALGMGIAFSNRADFSGISRGLFISAVIHKAYVDVNERGTEAAAATAVVFTKSAMIKPPTVFNANHPFMFAIRDNKTGTILFMGRIQNPTK